MIHDKEDVTGWGTIRVEFFFSVRDISIQEGLLTVHTRFFTPSKLEHTSMKEVNPPPLPKPPFFHAFQTGTRPNERRHPYPFYRSPRFFTNSKLEHTPMKEGTPPL